jgi:calcineurin-like phosphoesterase family protein
MKYFTSDWHDGHKNIIKYCDRPFKSIEEQCTVLLKNLSYLTEEDKLYVLGDCFFSRTDEEIRMFLNCIKSKKILIRGNHDRKSMKSWKNLGFDAVYKHLIITISDTQFLLVHDPVAVLVFKGPTICGHVHNLWKNQPNLLNVSVDVRNFRPVSEHEIWLENRTLNLKIVGEL